MPKKGQFSTHCVRGHALIDENRWPGGRCKLCSQARRDEGKNTWPQTEAGKRSIKNTELKLHYGITLQERDERLKAQGGCCACCGVVLDFSTKELTPHVDHKHVPNETRFSHKKVRGLLCGSCNRGLGQFKDNIEVMKKAVKYLEETQ